MCVERNIMTKLNTGWYVSHGHLRVKIEKMPFNLFFEVVINRLRRHSHLHPHSFQEKRRRCLIP